MAIAAHVPAGVNPSALDADTLLELAYLATAVDGRLADEEVAAFSSLVTRLRGKPARRADIDALLDRFASQVAHTAITDRVQKIAPTLPEPLRPLAFKLAVGLGVADLDASDDEGDLQVALAEALGLDEDRVDELTAEVYASLDGGDEG
jgi:hypothetical protein